MTQIAIPKTTPPITNDLRDVSTRLHDYWDMIVQWVQGNALELTIAIVGGVLVYAALTWAKRKAARVAREQEERNALTAIIARTLARTKRFFRIMVAAELVNEYANAPAMMSSTIRVFFTVAVVFQVAIWLREIILGMIERRASEGDNEHDTLANAMVLIRLLVSFALFAIAAIVVLDNLGVNVTGLVAGLGVGGIAIGLAAQGIFSDLFAAISIIFDKPFRRGDTVTYGTTTAKVEKIGMKSTRLRALTGEEKIISNSKLLDLEITNGTQLTFRRTTFTLALVYHTPLEKLEALPELLRPAVEEHHGHLVRAVFSAFGPSSMDFNLVFDVDAVELDALFAIRHKIGLSVVRVLRDNAYELAYPTQTTYTAAPDGTLIMPYAPPNPAAAAPAKRTRKS